MPTRTISPRKAQLACQAAVPSPTRMSRSTNEVVKAAVGARHDLGALTSGRRTLEIAQGGGGARPPAHP